MRFVNRVMVVVMVLSAVACAPGEEGEGEMAAASAANGDYEGIDTFALNLILDDLSSSEPPTEADCFGDIDIFVDDGIDPEIEGDGTCLLPANFMTYTLEGEIIDDESWEGEIVVVLNGTPHEFDVEGELDVDEIRGAFSGVNIVVGNIRGIWDGEFSAELVD